MIQFGRTIPVYIHPSFWLMAGAIGLINSLGFSGLSIWIGTAIWIFVILASVLIHEFGHALTARTFGQNASIELVALGGLTKRWGGPRLSLFKEFLVVLNGPLAGFCLCLIAYASLLLVDGKSSLLTFTLNVAIWVNLFWTVANLLPIQPLDGGKLFSIVLESLFGFRGVKIALFFSLLLSGLLALGCFLTSPPLVLPGAFFMIFAFESFRSWQSALPITESDVDQGLQQQLQDAERKLDDGDFDQAEFTLRALRERTRKGVLFVSATELLASCLAAKGDFLEAYDLLINEMRHLSDQGIVMLQQLAYRLGLWRQGADLCKKVYTVQSTYQTALLNARLHARLGEIEATAGWLHAAQRLGFIQLKDVVSHPDFDTVRQDPSFSEFIR